MKMMRLTVILAMLLNFGMVFAQEAENVTISIMVGASSGVDTVRQAAQQYMEQNPGVTIGVSEGSERTDDLLAEYSLFFDRQSGPDIIQLDVIWPGDLAAFMLDLNDYGAEEVIEAHFPAIIDSYTVDGKLLAMPWFTDAGLLYYRSDLLEKYGFDGPPATWDELEAMATAIQEGERADNPDFWGFVFQGRAYEGLTVNALEWIASNDGGTIISPEGAITINNDNAAEMLTRAANWIDNISPEAVVGFAEEESRNFWQAGRAAFMRNWPYVYSLANAEGSPVAGKFAIAPLPAGPLGQSVAGLGGWGLGIPSYSQNPELAADFVFFLTSPEMQKLRATESSFAPTVQNLYQDAEVLAANPFYNDLREILNSTVARPSDISSASSYRFISIAFFQAVHSVLTGERTAEEALEILESDLEVITGLPIASP